MLKNAPANAADLGSIPGLGRSCMPWSSEARGPQLLSLCSRARGPQRLSPCVAAAEARALSLCPGREEPAPHSQRAVHTHRNQRDAPAATKNQCGHK